MKSESKGRRILVWIGIPLAFVLSPFLALSVWGWPNDKPPTLVADLAKKYGLGGPQQLRFDTMLAQQFPSGSPEDVLRAELQRERFRLSCPDGLSRQLHPDNTALPCAVDGDWRRNYMATWYPNIICTGHAKVDWTADSQGRITTLHGLYSHECG